MKVLTVGAGGYAANYVRALLDKRDKRLEFAGIVEPFFERCPLRDEVEAAKIPVYPDTDKFFAENSADIAVISTPPFLHSAQSEQALKNGAFVLCEKPAAPTVAEVMNMIAAEEKYGKKIAVGYQWSYSAAVKELKRDIISGKLGKAKNLKTVISWPRNRDY